jgi:serine/threonine protein kinase
MKVFVKGKGQVNLSKTDFLAQGGEGKIFVKGKTAYKIYLDPKKMIPVAKIQELSSLSLPNIIRPERVILDNKDNPVGYTMRYVKDTTSLCKIFTKTFKRKNNIQPGCVADLVKKLYEGIQHVHSKQILIVDLNEMNFLLNNKLDDIFFIDTDSYKTKSYNATAIMESIRDRHSSSFSTNTDWFSFGIISFQMFIGIHPFKGKHSKFKNLDDRMMNNVSVLNKAVSIPKLCASFDVIPQTYREWYKAVFEDGKRVPPPGGFQDLIIIQPTIHTVKGSDNLDIEELQKYDQAVIDCKYINGNRVAITNSNIYINDKKRPPIANVFIGSTPKMGHVVAARIENGLLKLHNVTMSKAIDCTIAAEKVMSYDERIYVKNGLDVYEIKLNELGNRIIATPTIVANVMEKATHVYDGVILQDLLGACYASMFPEPKTHVQSHLKELIGYKIVDAKYSNRILMIVGQKKGKYDKLIFRFDSSHQSYDLNIKSDIVYSGLNFVVLDNGICVHINEDENIELFVNKLGVTDTKVVDDTSIDGNMTLYKNGNQVLFAKDNAIYKMSLKK